MIHVLDCLELRLDFLPSLPYRENRPLLHKKDRSLSYRKDLIEADIDILRVRFGHV